MRAVVMPLADASLNTLSTAAALPSARHTRMNSKQQGETSGAMRCRAKHVGVKDGWHRRCLKHVAAAVRYKGAR